MSVEEGTTSATLESAAAEAAPSEASESLLETGSESQPEGDEPQLTLEELEEIEYEGKKHKVPKELKDAFLRQQDYTRKTQEVADARRQFEAQQMVSRQTAEVRQQTIADQAQLIAIDNSLSQYRGIDWKALTEANPVQAMNLDREMRNLQAARQQVADGITQKQQYLASNQQQETARQLEQGRRVLESEISGWSPELQQKLMHTAKANGYRDEELAQISDPRAVKLLHKAHMYDQLMAQKNAKPKAEPDKPITTVGARSSAAVTDPMKLSPEAWAKRRNAEIAAKRKKR